MTRRNGKATKSIAAEIAELRSMPVAELVARYEAAFGKSPRTKNRAHLWRRIAWKVQEARLGGLSEVTKRRLNELIAEIEFPLVVERGVANEVVHRANGEPPIGTALVREWHGQEIIATRVEQGWEHNGVVYRSLTAVAKAATSSHRSGRAFFGLTKRKERSA